MIDIGSNQRAPMSPKVFISHASEDKERFVLAFAERLRQNGIDAWVDQWEMLPGDSLVDKIFEEGLKEAATVVVILSKFSVVKPWVRAELNAAVVKRINSGSKLIPVVIDDCSVPEALKSTSWQTVHDLASYDKSFYRIVAAIFGLSDKPPLGLPPLYTQSFVKSIGDLTKMDSLVLQLACEHALASYSEFIDPMDVYFSDGKLIVPESELNDSVEILEAAKYVSVLCTLGVGLDHFRITTSGLETYAKSSIPGYQDIFRSVVVALVNKELRGNLEIAAETGQTRFLVDHILAVLEGSGYLKQSKYIGEPQSVFSISPSLSRSLQR